MDYKSEMRIKKIRKLENHILFKMKCMILLVDGTTIRRDTRLEILKPKHTTHVQKFVFVFVNWNLQNSHVSYKSNLHYMYTIDCFCCLYINKAKITKKSNYSLNIKGKHYLTD